MDLESNIGDGNKPDMESDIGDGSDIGDLDGLVILERTSAPDSNSTSTISNANTNGMVELIPDYKELATSINETNRDVDNIANDLRKFRIDHDTFVETNEEDMGNIMQQLNIQKLQLDQHSKSLSLHSELLTKLDLNSQSVVNAINEMRMENVNNFNILNRNGQQHILNSTNENELIHSSNNSNSSWRNLRRPNLNQLETPSEIRILDSIMKENNISKERNISRSLEDISIKLEKAKILSTTITKEQEQYDKDCDIILKDIVKEIKKSNRRSITGDRGESKIEIIHSEDGSNHSSSSDSSSSFEDSSTSSGNNSNEMIYKSLVQTCNYEGHDTRSKRREKTMKPHETGIFAITVNLLIYEEKYNKTRILFQKRKYKATTFQNHLDLSTSGYVLHKETTQRALCRIAKEELNLDLSDNEVRDMYLLSWLPNDDNNKSNLRYSKGYLYICDRKDINVRSNLFKSRDITKCLDDKSLKFKPDTLALLSDASTMMKIINFINKKQNMFESSKINTTIKSKVRIDEVDDESVIDEPVAFRTRSRARFTPSVYDQQETFERSGVFARTTVSQNSGYDTFNRMSGTQPNRADNFFNRTDSNNIDDNNFNLSFNDDMGGYESLRSRRTQPICNLPDTRVDPRSELGHYEPNRFYIAKEPDTSKIYLSECTLTNVLAFCFAMNEHQKKNKDVIYVSNNMSNALIVQLNEAGITASKEFGYHLFGPKYDCIQINGVQVCHNDEVWMLIAFELIPQNRLEMREGLSLNVWPKTKTDFSIASNYQNHFPDFLRAVYVYIQRYKDKLRLLTFFKEGRQYYPTHAWTTKKRYGQIDYFLEGFPNKKIMKNINQDMKIEDMNSIHTLDEYIKFLLTYLRNALSHYKRERGKYDFVFNEKKERTLDEPKQYKVTSKSNNKYSSRFKSKRDNRDQSINELLDSYEDNVNNTPDAEDDDLSSSISSKSDSNEGNSDYLNGEGSSNEDNDDKDNIHDDKDDQLNNIPSTTTSKPNPNVLVCYEMVNTGSCKRDKCEYSHDKTLIEKFKQQRSEYRKKNPSFNKNNSSTPKSILRRK